jgi:ribosomal protein S18 acetylase RimI-like enzyme
MTICTATDKQQLLQILELQKENHKANIPVEAALQNGFLSVQHTFEVLQEMNRSAPQIIALDNEKVAGFALVMLRSSANNVPELQPLFDTLHTLDYKGKPVESYHFYIMGQICIAESYRSMGLFDQLYLKHKEMYASQFDFCLTEVAVRNTRSMRAHIRLGFQTIATYRDAQEEWNIMVWDWR